ncbi:hypothetical protein [Cyclobacterium jeungdonense]|uniref:Uncharacterized protein n=1 Tax=Cyclobacterium jeungdonense TaxID=708087 RepID=A0ABT8C5M7_9BACT|nr:hypothetical protein [Cyclobacterium jeungdonense]MDN3687093.1 hypothetical protein [Cyclobacterium jeungdonense]
MSQLKNLLVVVVILVLGVTAFLIFRTDYFEDQWDGIEMVSPNAVFLFETEDPVGFWNSLVGQPIWEKLNQLPGLEELESQLIFLDSVSGKQGNLQQYLKNQRFRLSLHPLGKEAYGFLVAIAFDNREFIRFTKNLEKKFENQGGSVKKRTYSGISLSEVGLDEGENRFTYATFDNVLLGSYHSFLVEDAIRYAQSEGLASFKATFPHLFDSQNALPASGMLRVSGHGLAGFIQDLTTGDTDKFSSELRGNDFSANLTPQISGEEISFKGELYTNGRLYEVDLVNDGGNSQLFSSLISNRAVSVSRYLLPEPADFKSIPNAEFSPIDVIQAEIEDNAAIQEFLRAITGQVALVSEDGLLDDISQQVLIVQADNPDSAFENLKIFALSQVQNDTSKLFMDYYLGNELFLLDLEDFPAHVFGGNFTGFLKSYLTVVDDKLVFSNSLRTLRNLLEDVYQDNTWGKSIRYHDMLKQRESSAPIQFFLNNDRFYPILTRSSHPSWNALFQKYSGVFGSFDWLDISFFENGRMEANLGIDLEDKVGDKRLILSESRRTKFESPLLFGPVGLQNYNDRSTDFLVQDEDFFIHLLTYEGETIFSQRVPGEIISDVFQIDYYKNGKLQLVFATRDLIYALDRFGNLLPGFPIHFAEGRDIEFLNVLDYDNNKDYRFFVSDQDGNLYLYSREGELFPEWGPKITNQGRLSSPPAHHRIPGLGDFMVAMHANGSLGLYNRRGESKTGVPIILGESVSTAYGIEEGISEGLAKLVTINDAGEVVKMNFKGELTYRNQLLRPDRDTRFALVNDQTEGGFVWVIKEYNKVKVLNSQERLLFEMSILSDELDYRYFSFGPDNTIFVVLDRVQEFAYLYNQKGDLINQKPINVSGDLWIRFSGSRNEYTLLTVYMNQLNEYIIPL